MTPPSHSAVLSTLDGEGWRSLLSVLRDHAAKRPNHEAVIDGATRLTYADLFARVEQAAAAFIASGVTKGDRVGIWAPNCHEWMIAAVGLAACGGVLVPLNTRFKGAEALGILKRSKATVLLTVRGFLGTDYPQLLRQAQSATADGLPDLREIVILRGEVDHDVAWTDFLARASSVSPQATDARHTTIRADDTADILFTSGTTGQPKGAMFSHGQMFRAVGAIAELTGFDDTDRYLIIPPFFHSFGYRYGFVFTLLAGATAVLQEMLDTRQLMQTIQDEKITFLPGPPTLFHSILGDDMRGAFDLSSLRITLVGAAKVPMQLPNQLRTELPFKTIIIGYGLTESTGICTNTRRGDSDELIATTSGRALPGVEVRIAGEDGTEQPTGASGEVWVRGFNVMQGYLDDPVQTAASITPDGWLKTGDVGVLDARGYLRIIDRIKDMFIVGGFNAYPAEIEGLMLGNAKIEQVAVVGAPDERLGEIGAAFVKLRPSAQATAEEIIAWCREAMANYKAPRIVEIVEEFPLNASGKVLKFALRERAAALAAASKMQTS